MLASVITTVYQFEWWHLPVGLAIMLIGMSWLGIYAAGFLTALDISRRCANSARSRGLNARFYARIGTLYSILSIGLGIYLIRKLQGTPTSSSTIRAYYVILFRRLVGNNSHRSFGLRLFEHALDSNCARWHSSMDNCDSIASGETIANKYRRFI